MADEGGGISTKSVLGPQKTITRIFSHVRYLFSIFPSNIRITYSAWYWPKLLQFGQSAQFGDELDICEWGWTWVKIQLFLNLGKAVLRGQKRKIRPYSNQSIENKKLCNTSKNQPPKSIRRRDMRIYPLFDLEKVLFLPYLPFKLS